METMTLHRQALDLATELIHTVRPADLHRPTPCTRWDLAALLAHMVGQSHGFADALRGGTDAAAYTPRPFTAAGWDVSVAELLAAVAAPATDGVVLAELSTTLRLPTATVVGFHLLDTAVHGWDVATALGRPWRPDPPLAVAVLDVARQIPTGDRRTEPGATFAPVVETVVDDPWTTALALTGRHPA